MCLWTESRSSLCRPTFSWNKGFHRKQCKNSRCCKSHFSPEYGESGDGIVSLTLKSGTNEVPRFCFYDNLRNPRAGRQQLAKQTHRLHQGVSIRRMTSAHHLGGPRCGFHTFNNGKDKTFFFFAYERLSVTDRRHISTLVCTRSFSEGRLFLSAAWHAALRSPRPTTRFLVTFLTNDPQLQTECGDDEGLCTASPTTGAPSKQCDWYQHRKNDRRFWDLRIDHIVSNRQRISGGFDHGQTFKGDVFSFGPIFGQSTRRVPVMCALATTTISEPTVVNQIPGRILAGVSGAKSATASA